VALSDAVPRSISVIRRTEHWIAVDKPAGLPSRPGPGHEASALSVLEAQLRAEGVPHPPGVVHRLDLGTSGVLLFSLSPNGHRALVEAFRAGHVHKEYFAITAGHPNPKRGLIDLALRRTSSGLSTPDRRGTPARTRYETRERFATSALVVAEPLTGRMHQIRAHLAARGTPVLGDLQYGGAELRGFRPRPPRLCLHAWRLRLPAELSGGEPTIECLMPEELERYLDRLRGTGPGGARARASELP
jgi:RluA family pseudouridine synthase